MRIRTLVWAALAAMIFVGLPGALRAEDEKEDGQAPPLSTRIYTIGALVNGRVPFESSFPTVQPPRNPWTEERSAVAEPTYPLGMVDEVIELLKGHVAPSFWEVTEGADVSALGQGGLVIRAIPAVHREVARYLAGLERANLRTVAVDVQAVRLTADELSDLLGGGSGERLDAAKVERVLAGDGRGPGALLILENRTRGEAFGGAQRSYLRRHEAVRGGDDGLTVPVAGVTNPGFAVSVQPIVHADGRSIRMRMNVSWSGRTVRAPVETARGDTVELPAPATLDVETDVVVAPGAWCLAHAVTDGWSILVRAVPGAGTGLARTADAIALDVPGAGVPGPMEVRDFDVASLARSIREVYGTGSFLYDTSSEGPPAQELPEPRAPFEAEHLVELLRWGVGSESMWEDPASIEARSGLLIVRNSEAMLNGIEQVLESLRRSTPAVFSTQMELVAVEPAVRQRIMRTEQRTGEAWLLDDEGRRVLDEALKAGQAERIDGGLLTSIHGVRNVLRSGQKLAYLSTYKAARLSGVLSIEPVTASTLTGLELDLRATLTPGGQAVQLEARCMRTHVVEPVRRVGTRHGDIELPELDTLDLRATLTAPLGRTALVGVLPYHGQEALLLLTPRRQSR